MRGCCLLVTTPFGTLAGARLVQNCGRTCVCCSAVRSGICVVVGRLRAMCSLLPRTVVALVTSWVQRAIRLDWLRITSDLSCRGVGFAACLPGAVFTRALTCRRRILWSAGALAVCWLMCPRMQLGRLPCVCMSRLCHPAGTKATNVVLGMARQTASVLVAVQEVQQLIAASGEEGITSQEEWDSCMTRWSNVLEEAASDATCVLRMLGLEAAFWVIVSKHKSDVSKAMEVAENYRNTLGYTIKMMHPAKWSSGSMDPKFTKFVDHDFAMVHPATEKQALECYQATSSLVKRAEAETPGSKEAKTPRTPREDRSGPFKAPRGGGSSNYHSAKGSSR
jgi:hypothetical protein